MIELIMAANAGTVLCVIALVTLGRFRAHRRKAGKADALQGRQDPPCGSSAAVYADGTNYADHPQKRVNRLERI